ncbi:MAG: hypothetical protein K6B65_02090 [Bacilli bacterium]|nr:hypothetical protein [Bacilli bacterium]
MNNRRMVLIGLAGVSIIGVLGLALMGQGVIETPNVMAEQVAKSITLDKNVNPAPTGEYEEYEIAAKTDGTAQQNHSKILMTAYTTQVDSYSFDDEDNFFVADCPDPYAEVYYAGVEINVKLNNITSFEFRYTCGKTTDKVYYRLDTRYGGPADGYPSEPEAVTGVTSNTISLATPHTAGDAMCFSLRYENPNDTGDSYFKLEYINLSWRC